MNTTQRIPRPRGYTDIALSLNKDPDNPTLIQHAIQHIIGHYIDSGFTGLPVTPNGSDLTIVWDSGSNKIFKL